VIYYERLRDEDSRLMVYDITFRDVEGIRREAERRHLDMEQVRDGALPPQALTACPDWMARNCPHQPTCACPVSKSG